LTLSTHHLNLSMTSKFDVAKKVSVKVESY